MINNSMTTSFKDYFHGLHQESDITDLRELLSQIDDAIRTAKETDTNDFEPRYVEFISNKVGELYDAITQQNLRLPADMQGDAGDRPQHLDTLNRLKGMVKAESTLKQLDEIINTITEAGPKKRNKSPVGLRFSQSSYDPMKRNKTRGKRRSIVKGTMGVDSSEKSVAVKPSSRNKNPGKRRSIVKGTMGVDSSGNSVDVSNKKPAYSQQKSVDTTPLEPGKKDFSTPFDIDPGSKVAGSYFKDTRSSRNTPPPSDTSIYTGEQPTAKPTPMDSSVKPAPKPFGRVDHRMGPHARRLASKGQGPRQPVGKIPIGDVPGKIASGLKGLGKKLVGGGTPLSPKAKSRQMRGFASRR